MMTPEPRTQNPEPAVLLTAETRRELDRLKFEVKRVPPGGHRAERNSRQRGAGIEFVDYRGYTPGDDFRALDLRAYLKHNRLFVKLFEEQQDLPVYILLDASRSMRETAADGASKFLFARQLAAAFAYVGLTSDDRVAVFPFADAALSGLKPLSGHNVVNRALDYLSRLTGGERTNLTRAIEHLLARSNRRGVAVLISDFFTEENLDAALSAIKRLRHDVAVVLVHDPNEVTSLPEGDLLLQDSETNETIAVTITPQTRQAYADAHREFVAHVAAFCRRNGVGFVQADITDSPARIVAEVVRQQGARGWGRNLQ
jgi:uncharacterized protein (DUF58 family)